MLYCRHTANKMDSLRVAKGPKTRAANPGSTPGRLPRTCSKSGPAAENLPQIRAGCPEPWGRQIFAQCAFWQAAWIWGLSEKVWLESPDRAPAPGLVRGSRHRPGAGKKQE